MTGSDSTVVDEENKVVGLDVHAETIAVAEAGQDREGEVAGIIPNREESVSETRKKTGAGRGAAVLL
jgi:hypothetical protein